MNHIAAVDIGGTHTDGVLLRADGELFTSKVRSTPDDPGRALLSALDELLAAAALEITELDSLIHGTTVATNAVIQGDFARVGLVTTAGFEDILTIGTQQRSDLYDPWERLPEPLVPRSLVVGAAERIAPDGSVVTTLDETALALDLAALRGRVDAIAVSLLFSFANPDHERRVSEIIAEVLPEAEVSLSSEIAPEFREYPRASTTALNAALLPRCGGYLATLGRQLQARGFTGGLQIMASGGGVVPASIAERFPASLLVSGPAAAAVAAARIGSALGRPDLVMLDVGGTSSDIALVTGGRPRRTFRGEAASLPVALPQIDVIPIGAGGGSVVAVDEFGSLSVGPDSLGADPGPACYGTSTSAALTDSHVVRGLISPVGLLGGALPLQADRAVEALDRTVAEPLGIPLDQAAVAAARIANAKMADTIRAVTLSEGVDVRDCALIAFGGAGPLHACEIAEDLGMRTVLVPRHPGLTAALGLLMGEARYEVSRTHIAPLAGLDLPAVRGVMDELAARARAELGAPAAEIRVELDLRYTGQAYELTVPAPFALEFGPADLPSLEEAFAHAHRTAYGHSWDDAPVELVTIRISAVQATPDLTFQQDRTTERQSTTARERDIVASDGSRVAHRVLHRTDAMPGLMGPAVLEQQDSTVLIPRNWAVTEVHELAMAIERNDHANR